jgi:hypothetical protein
MTIRKANKQKEKASGLSFTDDVVHSRKQQCTKNKQLDRIDLRRASTRRSSLVVRNRKIVVAE